MRRVLNKLSINITDEQFTKVMKIIDPNKSGRISYHQFLNLFEERESAVGFCVSIGFPLTLEHFDDFLLTQIPSVGLSDRACLGFC